MTKRIFRRIVVPVIIVLLAKLTFSFLASAQMTQEPPYKVKVMEDIVYGQGRIARNGTKVSRDLWMDAYLPLEDRNDSHRSHARPAVIYTYGGSFHIGTPRTAYNVDGARTNSPADYCRLFAGQGYVCFAIEYRLAPEEPIASGLGYTQDQIDTESIKRILNNINIRRKNLGLRPLDPTNPDDQKLLSDAVLSAAEDLKKALNFVVKNSGDYGVDPNRIVLGGFSAGAVTSMNVAHGMNASVAGVFMLSSALIGFKITETVTDQSNSPPALLIVAQHDLPSAIISAQTLIDHYNKVGVNFTFAWIPGFGHFYPSGATTLGADGTLMSLDERILDFLNQVTNN